jgi:hypothetical protein
MNPSRPDCSKTSDFETDFRQPLTGCVCSTVRLAIRKGFVDGAAGVPCTKVSVLVLSI